MRYEDYEKNKLNMDFDFDFNLELLVQKHKKRKHKEKLDPNNAFEAEIIEQRRKRLKDSLKALNR